MPRLTCWLVAAACFGQAPTSQFTLTEGVPVIRWEDAQSHLDERVLVVGKPIASRVNSGGVQLYFDSPRSNAFKIFVPRNSLAAFPTPPDSAYPGRWIRVLGLISEFRGGPEITVRLPRQIEILPGEPTIRPASRPAADASGEVKIGAYNVLNLFDEYDDPYTADETTPAKPRTAMDRLAASIRRLNADVLALEEVENRGVLERFVRTFLPDAGYEQIVLYEGNDQRGIDCAVLSRLPVGSVTSYRHVVLTMPDGRKTRFRRDLLRVRIEPPGAQPFDVFAAHLKSKRGEGTATLPMRMAEAQMIREVCDETIRADSAARFVVCGDFNDTAESDPLKTIRGSGPGALVCFVNELPAAKRITYNQAPYRSTIDYLFCSPAMAKCYVHGSYEIIEGTIESSGSDHNPIAARFRFGSAPTQPAPSSAKQTAVGGTPADH